MSDSSFWNDPEKSQKAVQELNDLKAKFARTDKTDYDKGNAIMTIFSGAGGDDAEDFSRILLEMYIKYIEKKDWKYVLLHEHPNEQGGYRNVTIEIHGRGAYGELKNESGVHRLVRLSPFNAKKQRHTSFSMVEVIPKFEKAHEVNIPDEEVEIEFAKSSGPGGQNVNKRETAVRAKHIPTGLNVHVESERTQQRNRDKALEILKGKIFKLREDERKEKEGEMYVSKTTDVEWGNQIRSYVFHPYQMVKDHRTGAESRNVDSVLSGGLDEFIEAERDL